MGNRRSVKDEHFLFGPFRLSATQRALFEGDRVVRLGSRALDILIALVGRAGELVGKRELVKIVWPETIVVEANLTVHVAALRRALGDGHAGNRYIVNVPGRGYRFVAPVVYTDELEWRDPLVSVIRRSHNLPSPLTRLIGRAEVVRDLTQRLSSQRLLTIVGPGGIGKTAVALSVAEKLASAYEDGVWLVELASITDPSLVPMALASTLELRIESDNPLPLVVAALKEKHMLLVLDNCEHVIDASASLAIAALKGSCRVTVLATSREPLSVEGERVCRLLPLESGPASLQLGAAEALKFSAVQLFVERAMAASHDFDLIDSDATSAVRICQALDGIPLAIEFAAAHVDTFGVRNLAAHLNDRLRFLAGGHREALPRHRTIGATLDWSYQLLSLEEQSVFRRLAVFAGGFTLDTARAVVADEHGSSSDIDGTVASLVSKSLIAAYAGDKEMRFRLLEITRAYALNKLAENGEVEAFSRRHSTYYLGILEMLNSSGHVDSQAAFAPDIENIRAALSWEFGSEGDASSAVALAAASAPILLEMSLLTECHAWMTKALDFLGADRGTGREIVLQTALGLSLIFTQGMTSRAHAALSRADELSESLQDRDWQLQAIVALAWFCFRVEDYEGGLVLARRAEAIAKSLADPAALSTADWMLGISLFFLGDYTRALSCARSAQARPKTNRRRGQIARWEIEESASARCTVVNTLWAQGLFDQSARNAREFLTDVQRDGHPVSLCLALSWCGSFVSLRLGDTEIAERSIARLKAISEEKGLSIYHACALGFEGQLFANRGDNANAERLLRAGLNSLRQLKSQTFYTPFLSDLARVLAQSARHDESVASATEALERTEHNHGFWWMTEALRIKGEVLLKKDDAESAIAAEKYFSRSLALAREQEALGWELRSATSLGRLYHSQGAVRKACDLLAPVYARFTEGFSTVDLVRAKLLLDDWTCDGATLGQRKIPVGSFPLVGHAAGALDSRQKRTSS